MTENEEAEIMRILNRCAPELQKTTLPGEYVIVGRRKIGDLLLQIVDKRSEK